MGDIYNSEREYNQWMREEKARARKKKAEKEKAKMKEVEEIFTTGKHYNVKFIQRE